MWCFISRFEGPPTQYTFAHTIPATGIPMSKFTIILIAVASLTVFCCVTVNSASTAAIDACMQPMVKGYCYAIFKMFYYNSANKQCEEFEYGGCGGNQNRFDTKEQCEKTCAS
ncbi:Kunitz-type serine protease inhibitor APEKTx1 [Orchesella cincta]|uniref:Kunitz-type serine protease inhibitor APEKTx1 n=1 Tax=Orchesella cincta TaxID=48709 RepID=A0A1D2MN24_ORCCI|nr:Kunitz-type serine protease inhibitor APEKTx1 [Orchesella cincta]